MIETLEIRADRILETWARELGDTRQGMYPATALDGNLALTETRNYPSRRKGSPAFGKETRRSPRPQMVVSSSADEAEDIMRRIKCVDCKAFEALALSYRVPSLRDVARDMRVGYGKARELRHRGFSMFCVMLEK